MQKIKVVQILSRLNIGGTASHVILLTEHLQDEHIATTLITGREDPDEGSMMDLANAKGVRVILLDCFRRPISPLRDLMAGFQIWRILRRIRPQVVHTHASKAGFLGRIAAIAAGVPIRIHTFHGHVLQDYFSKPMTRLFVQIERWLARRSQVIIGVSEEVCKQLIARGIGDSSKVRHIPIGLELDLFMKQDLDRSRLRQELGIPKTVALVGIVARLVPIKGHRVFFEAARILNERRRGQVWFLVVGDGHLRPQLIEQVQQLGLAGQVVFTGFRSDLDQVYSAVDIVALSSYNEGTPVTLIEALAAGKPGVATRVGGVPELIEDGVTGYLVEKGDAGALAERIGDLLDHPEQARAMGERGRERVFPLFGVERLADDLRQLYQDLARQKGF